jgi:D-beta-D-heptose 7-phosphate kinase/D-beta-D-heptose 1-phosphate adenosyltransferase
VTGAGDTVVSVVALALAAGADYPTASYLSNHAAGVVIREVGTATCSPKQLEASIADGRR